MLLAIDIGNTNINCGIFTGKRLVRRFSIPTKGYSIQRLRKLLGGADIDDSIICSVVPELTCILKDDLRKLLHKEPYCLGENLKVPIKNLYHKPKQVGQDRLVNAYAGIMLYGAPLVVVDFGTAITFDVVSKNREYLGGVILPGLEISLDVLHKSTALLPQVGLSRPKGIIGRDTQGSILSGVVYGSAILVNGLIKQIKKELGYSRLETIGTGGSIRLIRPLLKQIRRTDLNLTLKGLALLDLETLS
jgi:type III pantothenate kinase